MFRIITLFLFSILMGLPFSHTAAQELYFKQYTTTDGLPSSTVYYSYQDWQGYLWFCTDSGISCFDGYNFKNYSSVDGLSDNEIFQIREDSQKRLWFLTYNGLLSYYQDGQFYNKNNSPLLSQVDFPPFLTSFCEDDEGTIYLSSKYKQIVRISTKGTIDYLDFSGQVFYIWHRENTLYALTTNGIITTQNFKDLHYIPGAYFSHFLRAGHHKDQLVFAEGKRLYIFKDGNIEVVKGLEMPDVVTFITTLNNGNYAICTRSGLLEVSADLSKIENLYLKHSIVSHVSQDHEQNLWITTLGDGVYIAPSSGIRRFGKSNGLEENQISCLAKDAEDKIWLGAKNNYYASISDSTIQNFRIAAFTREAINKIRIHQGNDLFIASKAMILYKSDGVDAYFPYGANDLYIQDDFTFIAGSRMSQIPSAFLMEVVHKKRSTTTAYLNQLIYASRIFHKRTNLILGKQKDRIWFGAVDGLYYLENQDSIVRQFQPDGKLFATETSAIDYDSVYNRLVVATSVQGTYIFEGDHLVAHFNIENGLASNQCKSVLVAGDSIWVGTNQGLNLILKKEDTFQCINYSKEIGLDNLKISDMVIKNHELFLATDEGVFLLDLNSKDHRPVRPRMNIDAVYVNSELIENTDSTLQLSHSQNALKFDYTCLSFKDFGNIQYKYRIKGYQSSWRYTSNRSVIYEALPSGNFTFEIVGISGNNTESEARQISFSIATPLWESAWFLGAMTLLGALIVTLMWRTRINILRKRHDLERKIFLSKKEKLELEKALLIAEQKTGILQMNPHFIFNSLNTIKGFYAESNFSEANHFIAKFSKLLREILNCNKQSIPLSKEIEILNLYLLLLQKRYDQVFEYEIINAIEKPDSIAIPPMLIQPFVENAVIHGIAPLMKGNLSVRFSQENTQLICKITDNGIGINNSISNDSPERKSMGIEITKERLGLLKQLYQQPCSLTFSSLENGRGTVVELKLPLNKYDESHNY